nr:hypothetical protein BaRGS_003875 [Batillaria attramentaria]
MSTFLYDILPLCSGWGDTDEGIPDGLLFEGVSDKPIKVRFSGSFQRQRCVIFTDSIPTVCVSVCLCGGVSLAALPDYFEPWNQLAREMPELVAQDKMRQEVDKSILSGVHGTQSGDEGVVLASLQHITDTVKQMKVVLSHMHDKLSADTFFNIIRPYLGGWGGENNPLPHGLVYEGVSDQPIQAIGGSAAQSTTLQALDALLGVEHADVEKKNFLLKMRSYMPPDHCRFVEAIENQPKKLRDFVFSSKNKELQTVYNACVSAIVDFRSYHIQIVTKYIVQASAKAKQAEGKRFESLDKKGTGGTSIMPFLKTLRDDTRNQCIPTGISENGDQ